nr:hypothetical protein [uncultured archaeon]
MTSGEPTIVGLYTVRSCRYRGYGKIVLEAAIRRSLERGFPKIRIDVLTPKAMKLVQSLSEELLSVLAVHDQSMFGGFLE